MVNELLSSPSVMSHFVADIQSFAEMNNMELNSGKCKDMIVGFLHFNTSVLEPIVIGETHRHVSSFKLLGVYITNDLTWSVHCEHIISKSNWRLYALRKLKRSRITSSDILLVNCTIIGSILQYASVVFANLPQSLSNDLEKVQKKAPSIIYPYCSYENALKVAKIDSVESRRYKRFVETILPENPLYPIIHNCPAPQDGYIFMLRTQNQTTNQIRRSYKNDEFDWPFCLVTVT